MIAVIHDPRCADYSSPGHPERPARITATSRLLREQKEVELEWLEPDVAPKESILRAHEETHWRLLNEGEVDFDGDTPRYRDIDLHAIRGVGAALKAAKLAQEGHRAFSFMRPPGHHATATTAMGFCYLNSIAIAALQAQVDGAKKVAVFDFDVHHGNGTEAILQGRENTRFCSVHQSPLYPGTGLVHVPPNCFNDTVRPNVARETYRDTLKRSLDRVAEFEPDLIGVSAGFDAYAQDPLAQGTLLAEDFQWMGESIRALGIPFFSVLEGGYSDDLPELILAYLKGIAG